MENESLKNASPEDLMQMLAAQFGGITKTLEDSAKAFERAKSKHFHAKDYIFTSSEESDNEEEPKEAVSVNKEEQKEDVVFINEESTDSEREEIERARDPPEEESFDQYDQSEEKSSGYQEEETVFSEALDNLDEVPRDQSVEPIRENDLDNEETQSFTGKRGSELIIHDIAEQIRQKRYLKLLRSHDLTDEDFFFSDDDEEEISSVNVKYSKQDEAIIKQRLADAPTADDKTKILILFDFYKTLQKKRKCRARDFIMEGLEEVFKHSLFEIIEVYTERCKDRKNCGKFQSRLNFRDEIPLTESDDLFCQTENFIKPELLAYFGKKPQKSPIEAEEIMLREFIDLWMSKSDPFLEEIRYN